MPLLHHDLLLLEGTWWCPLYHHNLLLEGSWCCLCSITTSFCWREPGGATLLQHSLPFATGSLVLPLLQPPPLLRDGTCLCPLNGAPKLTPRHYYFTLFTYDYFAVHLSAYFPVFSSCNCYAKRGHILKIAPSSFNYYNAIFHDN
jgi:hypothetical protein